MRTIPTFVIALVLLVSTASAQDVQFKQHRNCIENGPMLTCIDRVDATTGVIYGWSLDKNTGHLPAAFMLWNVKAGTIEAVPAKVYTGERPDVAKVYGTADTVLGWAIVPDQPLKNVGIYSVLVTDVPYSQHCGVFPADYPPAYAGQLWCDFAANELEFVIW